MTGTKKTPAKKKAGNRKSRRGAKAAAKKATVLDRSAILAADDVQTEVVDVPEWGGAVIVQSITAGARDALEEGEGDAAQKGHFRARMVVASVVDDDGQPVFTSADIPALSKKSARAMERVANVALRLNGVTDADVAALEKN